MVIYTPLLKHPSCGSEVACWHSQPYHHRDAPVLLRKPALYGGSQCGVLQVGFTSRISSWAPHSLHGEIAIMDVRRPYIIEV